MIAELKNMMILAATPFDILSQWQSTGDGDAHNFILELGMPQLGYAMTVMGIWCAIITIMGSVFVLAIVKNPMLVSRTKTKVVAVLIILGIISCLPFLFDVMGGLANEFILGG